MGGLAPNENRGDKYARACNLPSEIDPSIAAGASTKQSNVADESSGLDARWQAQSGKHETGTIWQGRRRRVAGSAQDVVLVETNHEDVVNVKRTRRRWQRKIGEVRMQQTKAEAKNAKIERRAKRAADKAAFKAAKAQEKAEKA